MPDQTVDLYRLTGEIISNDPVTQNIGAISYQYDPVGNRTNRTSGITAISSQTSLSYDSNDRLTGGYSYDADGNTLTDPAGNSYSYDSLDRMTSATVNGNTSTYTYDGDGNKVQETSNSGSRQFLVDSENPTGYAQVLETLQSGSVNKVYTYGTSRISEDQYNGSSWTLSFYGYDGQGSVRYLTDINGNVVNPYEYDAFGNTIYQNNTVSNVMLYDGEEQSPNTGFYNLRARWMNPTVGRFISMDKHEGETDDPLSLHKYEFVSNDPNDKIDPTGKDSNTVGSAETKLLQGWVARRKLLWSEDQVTRVIFNEMRSLSGNGIDGAYIHMASAIWNGLERLADTGQAMPPMASPDALISGSEQYIYDNIFPDVVVAESARLGDEVVGPFNFNLRNKYQSGSFYGLPKIWSHDGPFDNSYPTDVLDAHDVYVNTYGK